MEESTMAVHGHSLDLTRNPARARLGLAFVIAAAACSGQGSPPAPAGSAPSKQAAGASSSLTVLTRGAHPLARAEFDAGRLEPDKRIEHLSVVYKLTPAQIADRDALVEAVSTPGSPSYRKWLTTDEYAARFGARPEDIARTTAWLASQGLEVSPVTSPLGARSIFSGTVAQLEAAFHTEMHRYNVRGEMHYAMANPPSIPTELADVVLAIKNTHDFYPTHGKLRVHAAPPPAPCNGGCQGNGIAPPDWATIYDVTPLYTTGINGTPINGQGVTLIVVGTAAIAQSDITAFRQTYGLAANNITTTIVPGTGTPATGGGTSVEAILDTEWSGAIAPNATVNFVLSGADNPNPDNGVFYAIEQNNLGTIISESFGGCEMGFTPADADVLGVFGAAANLLGITYLASSGDDGAATCLAGGQGQAGLWVDIPASYPGVTGVGGTGFDISPAQLTFDGNGNVTSAGTESVWNETAVGGGSGGGGISAVFALPSYQTGLSCTPTGSLPTTTGPSPARLVPDVAFTAAGGSSQFGILIECTDDGAGGCSSTGGSPSTLAIAGTSASSPSFAGVLALVSQAVNGRLGNVNPLLYTLGSESSSAIRDVTTGNNFEGCNAGTDPGCPAGGQYGYSAAAGYDCASGLGSVDVNNLVTAWSNLSPTQTSLSPSTSSAVENTPITLTATVTSTGSTAIGGIVTFAFESFLANGQLDLSSTFGTTTISGGTAGSATATLTAPIPPGLAQPNETVKVVAQYGGDPHHQASVSTPVPITFSTVNLCISPTTTSVAAGGTFTYTHTGGVPPVLYYISADTTTDANGQNGSQLNETTGAFTAGTGAAGYVLVQAVDSQQADTFSEVTVGSPTGTPPWAGDSGVVVGGCALPPGDAGTGDDGGGASDSGTSSDSGSARDSGFGSGVDSGPVFGGSDASNNPPNNSNSTTSSSSCSCRAVKPAPVSTPALAGLGLALLGVVRARRRRK
jgi:pro-kumamolisin-like protein